MPLINCKVELSLTCNPNRVLSSLIGDSTIKIIDANLYVPIATLSAQDNAKLSKLLSKGFNIQVYWNKYKIIPNKAYDENDHIRKMLHSSYQGVQRLFGLAYRDRGGANRFIADSHRKNFFPRVKTENCNIEIDGRNFYDQPINDLIKQYDKIRKMSTVTR